MRSIESFGSFGSFRCNTVASDVGDTVCIDIDQAHVSGLLAARVKPISYIHTSEPVIVHVEPIIGDVNELNVTDAEVVTPKIEVEN